MTKGSITYQRLSLQLALHPEEMARNFPWRALKHQRQTHGEIYFRFFQAKLIGLSSPR